MFLRNNIKNLSDQELLIRYRATMDQHLLAGLFTRYTHMVFGVCMKYLSSTDEASEAILNIFEKLCRDIHRHEIVCFPSWLYVITKNHCLMELRHRKTMGNLKELWHEEHLVFMESDPYLHPLDEDEFPNREKLRYCLRQLNREQRKCIELFYFHRKCFKEIAEALKQDENRIKSYIQQGKRNLKNCLEQKHEKETEYNDTPSSV